MRADPHPETPAAPFRYGAWAAPRWRCGTASESILLPPWTPHFTTHPPGGRGRRRDGSAAQTQILADCEHVWDDTKSSVGESAARVQALEVSVLVDLTGAFCGRSARGSGPSALA